MGRITSRRERKREPFRPIIAPRNVDRTTWLEAYHHRQSPDAVRLEELPVDDSEVASDPTPAEIAEAGLAIRSTWGPSETEGRRVQACDVLRAPMVTTAELLGALGNCVPAGWQLETSPPGQSVNGRLRGEQLSSCPCQRFPIHSEPPKA